MISSILKIMILWYYPMKIPQNCFELFFFCTWAFFQTLIFTAQQGLGENHLYSYLPLSTFQYYSDVYLQLGKWDDYVVILIPLHIIIKFLLDEIYSPSWISIWLNVTSFLTNNSMLDLVTVICCCQVVDFNWHRLSSIRANWP